MLSLGLFMPRDVRERLWLVPESQDALLSYADRCLINRALEDLSRETYNLTGEAIGDGPICLPLVARTAGRERSGA